MSELDLCSRREADRWIQDGCVVVNGQVAVLGQQVDAELPRSAIEVSRNIHHESLIVKEDSANFTTAVVLNKPPGYVSGQAEHGHLPAIRLLNRERLWNTHADDIRLPNNSWKGFAPAGRLDLESTGLLVFAHSGIISKKLISHESTVDKEYTVGVVPAVQVTRREFRLDEAFRLPTPSLDLSPLTSGGGMLLGDKRPLKPCKAHWSKEGSELQIALREGRKQHIRRACREILGYHVISLDRTRIGPIEMGDLPMGCWRPLTTTEIDSIVAS